MALTDNTTWYGKDAQGFYSKAFLSAESIKNMTFYPNVKSKEKIGRVDVATLLQAGDCSFNDAGGVTLSQKTLEVCPLKINVELCIRDFEQNYLSLQMRAGSNNSDIPQDFETYILDQFAKYTAAALEVLVWQGDVNGSPASLCDGLLVGLGNDSLVVPVSGTTLTAANIIVELTKLYNAVPYTVLNNPDLRFYLGNAAIGFYALAQAAVATASGTYYVDKKALTFLGIPIVIASGMPANTMVASTKTNLWVGGDLLSDESEVKIIDMRNTTGAPTKRFIANFKYGASYGVSEEIVLYS